MKDDIIVTLDSNNIVMKFNSFSYIPIITLKSFKGQFLQSWKFNLKRLFTPISNTEKWISILFFVEHLFNDIF